MTHREKGAILLTTLWILTLLALLALGVGIRAGIDIKLIGLSIDSAKARYLAEAGIRKTIALLESDEDKKTDSLNELWSSGFDFDEEKYVLKDIEIGEGSFTVSYELGSGEGEGRVYLYGASDEEGKLNVNEISGDTLARLPGFTNEISDSVLDWRDEDSLARVEGAEDDYYGSLDNPYECKDGPFSVPEELLLVKGVTREIYQGVKDIVTVYGGNKAVNINTAPEKVLMILAGEGFEDIPSKIAAYRNGQDGFPGTEDDRVFTNLQTVVAELSTALTLGQIELNRIQELVKAGGFKVLSGAFRIVSRGEVKKGRVRSTAEVVAKREGDNVQTIYYHEDR